MMPVSRLRLNADSRTVLKISRNGKHQHDGATPTAEYSAMWMNVNSGASSCCSSTTDATPGMPPTAPSTTWNFDGSVSLTRKSDSRKLCVAFWPSAVLPYSFS